MATEMFGKYEIRGRLGAGAMGTVFDAFDPVIERRAALKTVRRPETNDAEGQEAMARFKREAQAAGRLNHPNIVAVYDYGEDAGNAWIAMELVEGGTLKDPLDRGERFPLPQVVRLMDQVLAALDYSHKRGVVHRDIKPANIMLTTDGSVKIADFGIARIENSSMTQVGTIMGTPAYMAPEQLRGEAVDSRADIWAAGVVLYQLLTGEKPFAGGYSSVQHKALNTEPTPPSALTVTAPKAFDGVIGRAMAKRPEDRFATAGAFAEALREAVAAPVPAAAQPAAAPPADDATVVATTARPAPARTPPPKPAPPPVVARKGPPVALIAGGGALVAAGVAAFLLLGGERQATPPIIPVTPPQNQTQVVPPDPRLAVVTPPPQNQTAVIPPPGLTLTPVTPPPGLTLTPVTPPQNQNVLTPPPGQGLTPVLPPQNQLAIAPPPGLNPITPLPQNQHVVTPPNTNGLIVPQRQDPPPTTDTKTPEPPRTQIAALPPPRLDFRAAAAAAVAAPGCALLAATGTDQGLAIEGVLRRGEEATLRRTLLLRDIPTTAARLALQSFDGPYCASLDTLRPVLAPPNTAPRLRIVGNPPLLSGQLLRFDVTMPDWAGNLTVSYFMVSGDVAHLAAAAPHPAGAIVRLGEPRAGFPGWDVSEPYGTDLMIAIVSDGPLFASPRPDVEPQQTYLAALTEALRQARTNGRRVLARPAVVETAAR